MNNIIFRFLIAVMAVWLMSSCSSTEEVTARYPYISSIANTDCIDHTYPETYSEDLQSIVDDAGGSFEMTFEGTTAKCKFTSLNYPCDFDKVNVKVNFKDGILTIVEFPSSDDADCRCMTDATFSIMNMPEEDFILKIYHGDTKGHYNDDSPIYSGIVSIEGDSLTISYQN